MPLQPIITTMSHRPGSSKGGKRRGGRTGEDELSEFIYDVEHTAKTILKEHMQRRVEETSRSRKMQKKRNLLARAGEADRHEGPKLIKHRLAGKSGLGTKRSR